MMVEKTPRWRRPCQITHDGEDYDAESIEESSTMEECFMIENALPENS